MANVTKTDLVALTSEKFGEMFEGEKLTKETAKKVIQAYEEAVLDAIEQLEKVEGTEKYEKVTTGLITYTKADKTGGERKNPLTGKMITVPNKTVPKAKLNKVVKDLTVVEE